MLATEKDATTKWCPMVRVAPFLPADGGGAVFVDNRGTQPFSASDARCIGTACMAWCWFEKPAGLGARRESVGFGYCGLAGTPTP